MASGLSPQNEQFIQQALAGGRFTSRDDLIDKAVETLREVEAERAKLVEDVNLGVAQLDAGQAADWTTEDLNRILREGRNRLGIVDYCRIFADRRNPSTT